MAARRPRQVSAHAVPGMEWDRHWWVYDVLDKHERLREILGVDLGELLGCGFFGCVLSTNGPWVVKLTVDPTETIWVLIEEKVRAYERRTGKYLAAWPRVKDVLQLEPGVSLAGGAERKLYAIVREAARPAFERPGDVSSTEATLERMGVPKKIRDEGYDPVMGYRWWEWRDAAEAITQDLRDRDVAAGKAREVGRRCAELIVTSRLLRLYKSVGEELAEDYDAGFAGPDREAMFERHAKQVAGPKAVECLRPLVEPSAELNLRVGRPLGELLTMLAREGIVLADLHLLNIGWREHQVIDGDRQPSCLMVIDPGATPTTGRTEIERRMIANGRWRGR